MGLIFQIFCVQLNFKTSGSIEHQPLFVGLPGMTFQQDSRNQTKTIHLLAPEKSSKRCPSALTQCSSSMQQILPVCSQTKPVQKNTHLHTKRFRMHSLTRPTIATKMARTIYYLHPSTPEPTASVACQQKAKTQSLGFVGTFSAVVTGSAITSLLSESFLAMFGVEFRKILRHG